MQSFSIQINEPDVIKVPTFFVIFFHEYLNLPVSVCDTDT